MLLSTQLNDPDDDFDGSSPAEVNEFGSETCLPKMVRAAGCHMGKAYLPFINHANCGGER